jgi:hypothetical protein
MYESVAQMREAFPYFSARQVRSALDSLIQQGAVDVGCFNRLGLDRTRWYTLTDYGWSLVNGLSE